MIEGAFSSIVGGSDTEFDDSLSLLSLLCCRSDFLLGVGASVAAAGVVRFLRGGIG